MAKLLHPKNWRKVKLEELIKINPDQIEKGQFKKIQYIDISSVGSRVVNEIKELNIEDAPGRAKRLVKHGDTIISTVRPYRKSYLYIKNPAQNQVVSTGFAVIRPKNASDANFIHYLVTSEEFVNYLTNHMEGTAYPAVDPKIISERSMSLPDEKCRKKIGHILSTFDDKIELNNKINQTLEQMAQAIFKEWFVDFRFPGHEKVKMVDSEVGKIPEGWELGLLGDVLDVKHGFAFPSKCFRNTGEYPIIKIKNISEDNRVNLAEVSFINPDEFENKLYNFELFNGDVLVAMTGATSGKIGILADKYSKYYLNQRVGKLKFVSKEFKWFSYIFLTRKEYRSLLLGFSDGSAQGNLSPSQIKSINIIIPNKKILSEFQAQINLLFEKLISNILENQYLASLRDVLLPKLMGGEVRV